MGPAPVKRPHQHHHHHHQAFFFFLVSFQRRAEWIPEEGIGVGALLSALAARRQEQHSGFSAQEPERKSTAKGHQILAGFHVFSAINLPNS